MPKIFRGTTPTPQPPSSSSPSSQDAGSLGKPSEPTKSSEPARGKYSTKSQYRKYQTRQDPINGSGNNVSDRLSIFKAKHSKDTAQEEKSIFKHGEVAKHSLALEKKALREYSEATGKSYREVEANKKKVLEKLGLKGQKWHRKEKIMRGIAAVKKRMPHMKSWEREEERQISKAKRGTFGLKSSKRKSGWF